MSSDEAFALLITWTCFGQWLPGDRRGYVSNTLSEDGYRPKNNVVGAAYDQNDAATYQRAKQLQKQTTVWLTAAQARVAAQAMIRATVERGWVILRGAVMANHVHMVVADCPDDGPAVRRVLKGVSQAALSKAAGQPRTWWTAKGSDRYKHGHAAVEAAINYVAEQERVLVHIVNNEIVDA
jgi:REP element-mobilizing transposase RayT